ncbi:hypothetical protein ACSDR0_36160 [Streptosporangium sp. G11]|uniref:hypothetical protein n=1 Tax=Streptosporangium sp. G11 TaxID=3436926 RepID=UPI003EB83902
MDSTVLYGAATVATVHSAGPSGGRVLGCSGARYRHRHPVLRAMLPVFAFQGSLKNFLYIASPY